MQAVARFENTVQTIYQQREFEPARVALNAQLHWLREKRAVLDVEVTQLEALTRSIARS